MPAVGSSEKHQLRPANHRARQRESLLLSAGQSPVRCACRLGQSERVHQPLRVEGVGGICGNEIEHLAGSRRGIRAAALQHHTDASADLRVVGERIQAQDLDAARVGLDEALAHLHSRGLARTVGAEQREHLGGLHVEVEV